MMRTIKGKRLPKAVMVLAVLTLASTLFAVRHAEAAFPGQNGKIAFASSRDRDLESSEIYVMNPDGSNQTRLTDTRGHALDPAGSPDGTKIAFLRNHDDIYVMDADGSNPTKPTIREVIMPPPSLPTGPRSPSQATGKAPQMST